MRKLFCTFLIIPAFLLLPSLSALPRTQADSESPWSGMLRASGDTLPREIGFLEAAEGEESEEREESREESFPDFQCLPGPGEIFPGIVRTDRGETSPQYEKIDISHQIFHLRAPPFLS
ncbi:MAG: hypothetical protein JXA95_15460 [Spirochaetales bacterium]|nr:hypothetical protein [Spirochaetales bacterium]